MPKSLAAEAQSNEVTLLNQSENVLGALREEYFFVASCSGLSAVLWYPAIQSVAVGEYSYGFSILALSILLVASLPFSYACYLRDTGKMKGGSPWSKLVPRDTLVLCEIADTEPPQS